MLPSESLTCCGLVSNSPYIYSVIVTEANSHTSTRSWRIDATCHHVSLDAVGVMLSLNLSHVICLVNLLAYPVTYQSGQDKLLYSTAKI
jgi:hypothetical protein